ncbi:bacteriocin [uncultured Flavobacterium sp.]
MKNNTTKNVNTEKNTRLKNLKPIPKNELEAIIGGPETSRGTRTEIP